jgi:hypothetical protein
MAPAIAAMASILFRMINSFAMMHAGSQPARSAIQFISRGNVPGTTRIPLLQFSASSRALELVEAACVGYRGTRQGDKCKTSIRIPSRA